MKDGLETIKQVNLLILDEIHRVSECIGVNCFLLAGTMLGAVREGDFIPWDDDADVGMLRADYQRFLEEAPKLLKPEFELVLPQQFGGFYDMIAKVSYRRSRLHKETEEDAFYGGYSARISVDLYVLDAAAPGQAAFALQIFRLKMVYGMMMRYRYRVKDIHYTLLEHAQVLVLRTMGHFRRLDSLRKEYERICRKYEHKKYEQLFVSNSVLQKIDVRYDKQWFSQFQPVFLKGHSYRIPLQSDEILKARYGSDYMTPKKETFTIVHADLAEVEVWTEEREETL